MNRKYLATAGWLLVAMLTFALGWTLRPAQESSDPSPAGDGTPLVGKAPAAVSPDSVSEDGPEEGTGAGAGDPDPGAQFAMLKSGRSLSSAEIEDLGRQFKGELDPIKRRIAFTRLLEGLTAENAKEIRAQIAHLNQHVPEFQEFHYAWGQIGGLEAVMHGAETDKRDMVATLAGWTSADPDAATKWFDSLDAQSADTFASQAHLRMGMVHGLANTDPDLAAAFIFKMAAAGVPKADGMLGIVAGKILQAQGPIEAAAWAANLPEGALRTSAMGRVVYAYAERDPAAAAAWAGSTLYQEGGGRILSGISSQWARRDGAAAVGWLESLGDSPGRPKAFYSAFEGWAGNDPIAASEYLSAMPVSDERDYAIGGLVSRHRWDDPEAAIVWADSISSEKERLEAIIRAGQAWTHLDASAAAEWAKSSGLPEKLQQAIIHPPRKSK